MISQRVRTLMCALFALFLFVYLYVFQSPLLALVQHQLAEGQTVYMPLISALVLTVLLMLLQRLLVKWVYFSDVTYSFSFIPSALLAILLTAFTPEPSVPILVACTVFLLWFVGVVGYTLCHRDQSGFAQRTFAHTVCLHLLAFLPTGILMGAASHSQDVLTYELQVGRLSTRQQYEEALEVGRRSLATSSRLTALRAYALAHTPEGLGERFFTYPLSGTGSGQLMFSPADTLKQLLCPDSLYADFLVWPSTVESPLAFWKRVKTKSSSVHVKDYWLTALLLEKELDTFVKELPMYYPLSDSISLPRHYGEALTLYAVSHHKNLAFPSDSAYIVSYNRFVREKEMGGDYRETQNLLRRQYGDTYWWYYYFQEN